VAGRDAPVALTASVGSPSFCNHPPDDLLPAGPAITRRYDDATGERSSIVAVALSSTIVGIVGAVCGGVRGT